MAWGENVRGRGWRRRRRRVMMGSRRSIMIMMMVMMRRNFFTQLNTWPDLSYKNIMPYFQNTVACIAYKIMDDKMFP